MTEGIPDILRKIMNFQLDSWTGPKNRPVNCPPLYESNSRGAK